MTSKYHLPETRSGGVGSILYLLLRRAQPPAALAVSGKGGADGGKGQRTCFEVPPGAPHTARCSQADLSTSLNSGKRNTLLTPSTRTIPPPSLHALVTRGGGGGGGSLCWPSVRVGSLHTSTALPSSMSTRIGVKSDLGNALKASRLLTGPSSFTVTSVSGCSVS